MGIQDRDYYRINGKVEPRFEKINGQWKRIENPRELGSGEKAKIRRGCGGKARKLEKLGYLIFALIIVIAVLAVVRY